MADTQLDVIDKVRRALGRTAPLAEPPVPPAIDEPITRLVHSDIGLPELLASTAEANKIHVTKVRPEEMIGALADYLRSQNAKRVALSESALFTRLGLLQGLIDAGFEATPWSRLTLDALYDYDCGITDVAYAVAEIGGLVVRASPEHGRALSLVPPIHIAIVEPSVIVPDLVDLFQRVTDDGVGTAISIITGPSKTSDIEMNLVVGVHGPITVQMFLIA